MYQQNIVKRQHLTVNKKLQEYKNEHNFDLNYKK